MSVDIPKGFVQVSRERFDDFLTSHELNAWQHGTRIIYTDEQYATLAIKDFPQFGKPCEQFWLKPISGLM